MTSSRPIRPVVLLFGTLAFCASCLLISETPLFSQTARIKIIAFGDSTTAGTPGFRSPVERPPHGAGNPQSQYAYWVRKRHPEWSILNRGVNAERTDQILKRFDRDVAAHHPDVVVILAGVNDLYQGDSVERVTQNLSTLYSRARAAGIKILACSILPYNNGMTPQIEFRMRRVNEWILAESGKRGFGFCDTRGAVVDPAQNNRLASTPDGLHPDVEGYRKMGFAVAEALEKVLEAKV